MGVAVLDVGVGDDDVRALAADDRDQPADGVVEGHVGEAAGVLVLGRARHARVAVAEPDDLVVAEDLGRLGQLLAPNPGDVGPHLCRCPSPGSGCRRPRRRCSRRGRSERRRR